MEKWNLVRELVNAAAIVLDEHSRVVSADPCAIRLFQREDETDLIGRAWATLAAPPEARSRDLGEIDLARRREATLATTRRWVSVLAPAMGEHQTILWTAAADRGEGASQVIVVGIDLGPAAREIARAAEGAALARMEEAVERVAHEVGNVAAGVTGALGVLAERLPGAQPHPIFELITQRVRAMTKAIEELRARVSS
ncbi:MAG: hypothetical protein IT384_15370 [Deltaproteobacteria bacterium]|nr:hypothetical protein [Deltaproteobacteria bacterium]